MLPAESTITVWSAITCGGSLLLLLIAFRGRRIDDHPTCRKCGFDLFGLPATSLNCPECGRDIKRRRAVRVGHRRRFKSLLVFGLMLFLLSSGWLGFLGVMIVRHDDWNRRKPLAWLMRDVNSPVTRDGAIGELIDRVRRRELSDKEVAEIANLALAHQADRSVPWLAKWGQFLEAAQRANRLGAAQWHRYEQQALDTFVLEVRPEVRRDHPIPFRVTRLSQRGGSAALSRLRSLPPLLHLDGQVLRASAVSGSRDGSMDSTTEPYEGLADLPSPRVMQLQDGEHQAGVTTNFKTSTSSYLKSADDPPYLYQTRVVRPIEINSGDRSTVSVHKQGLNDAQIDGAIAISVTADRGQRRLNVTVKSAGAPVHLAFEGRLSAGKLQRDLGFILFPANRPGTVTITLYDVLPAWDPDKVDIDLLPSLDAAEHTVDMFDIWGGHVSRAAVPVK
ncbi:MAG: hypothetical protein JWN40_3918 [Phycisphaerales bacterium]|nr:hypothetical protein [Phycisphaerales bacterium]